MNNGRFDLKRKLAFVAALAFAANSAGSMSAAGAETALTAAGTKPSAVGAPGDVPPPPAQGSDEFETITYNLIIKGIEIDEDGFRQILRLVFGTEGSWHSYNSESGMGTVTISGYHNVNRVNIVIDDDTRLLLDDPSENGDTLVFNAYYRVNGHFNDERITMTGRDGEEHYELRDGFCRSGTVLEIAPTECYMLDSGSESVDVLVDAPVEISTEDDGDGDDDS